MLDRVRGQTGVTLIEVLVTTLVTAIAALGLALMYAMGGTFVVARGDDRTALGLAQQKIEQLKALTYACVPVGDPGNSGPPPGVAGCPGAGDPRYVFTEGPGDPAVLADRTFVRLTCVQWVTDTNLNEPAYAGGADAVPCEAGLETTTKRITVVVTPTQRESEPVVLQAWVTSVGP